MHQGRENSFASFHVQMPSSWVCEGWLTSPSEEYLATRRSSYSQPVMAHTRRGRESWTVGLLIKEARHRSSKNLRPWKTAACLPALVFTPDLSTAVCTHWAFALGYRGGLMCRATLGKQLCSPKVNETVEQVFIAPASEKALKTGFSFQFLCLGWQAREPATQLQVCR